MTNCLDLTVNLILKKNKRKTIETSLLECISNDSKTVLEPPIPDPVSYDFGP